MGWSSVAIWAGLLSGLRAGTTDFALRPERFETRATIPAIEAVLRDPLTGPAAADALGAKIANAASSSELIAAGFASLGVTPAVPAEAAAPQPAPVVTPAALQVPISHLIAKLSAAHADLEKAVASLPPEERERALIAADAAVDEVQTRPVRGEDFDAAVRFDLPRLAAAALAAARAVDEALPALMSAGGPAFTARATSDFGDVLISSGDVEYGPEELSHAGLIVRLGGRTRYRGPVAAAGPGQLRVVVDLGGPAVIESTGTAGGAGEFGVGLLYLAGTGPYEVSAGGNSLGAGRFGVGYASVVGNKTKLSSRHFGQGAAAFGVGVLETRGDDAALTIPLAGQGLGATRGAGIWRHRGAGLSASCGFEFADAREPLGTQSLGQGAGMGPRAFAAGGIGVAHVTGDRATLNASYFAQGSGYWRGLGALFIRGDDARLQARRYSLGTGVHAAVGVLDVKGRRARIDAWGAGPALGWDYGVGLFRLRGDEARARSDWADGRAELGGRSLTWIEGDRDEISLAEFGAGTFSRAQAGYGAVVLRGKGGRVHAPGLAAPVALAGDLRATPWAALHAEGAWTLDSGLKLPDPTWPAADQSSRAAAEAGQADRLLQAPPGETPRARVARLLYAASVDILDPRPADGAARGLASLNADDAPALASLIDPDRFDELIWARLAASSLGPAAARAAAAEATHATGTRRTVLLDWLRFGRAEEALPVAEAALRDADWRVRRQGAVLLGALFGNEGGDEQGRLRFLRDGAAGKRRLGDLYAALALAGPVSAGERLDLLAKAGTPFDMVARAALDAYAAALSSSPARAAAVAREASDSAALAARAAADLRAASVDPDDETAASALQALGGVGGKDAPATLAAALTVPSAARREAAASGLARLGPTGKSAIARALSDHDARVRALAALAAAQSWDKDVFALLSRALKDREASVRAAAVAGLGAAQATLAVEKKGFLPALHKIAARDPDNGVRASAALAAAAISPAQTP
jgi:HEAT repeat protein